MKTVSQVPSGPELPTKLAVDADGYCWRLFDVEDEELAWSMARINPDNSPIPEPVTYYHRDDPSDYGLVVRYIDPPSGAVDALEGWAVAVHTKDGVSATGIFRGNVPREGMFQIVDTLDDHLILGADFSEIEEVVVL